MPTYKKLEDIEDILDSSNAIEQDIKGELESLNTTALNTSTNTGTSNSNETTMIADLGTIVTQTAQNVPRLQDITSRTTTSNTNEATMITELQAINANTLVLPNSGLGFGLEIRRGQVPVLSPFELHSSMDDLKNTETLISQKMDIDGSGALFATNSADPAVYYLKSIGANAGNDVAAGTGARTVKVTGWTFVASVVAVDSETITLLGATAVPTVKLYSNIQSVEVLTVGATGFNEGDILVSRDMAGLQKQMGIAISDNFGASSIMVVPTDTIMFCTRTTFFTTAAGTTQQIELKVKKIPVFGPVITTRHVEIAAAGNFETTHEGIAGVVAGTVIFFTALRTAGTGSLAVFFTIQGFFEDIS